MHLHGTKSVPSEDRQNSTAPARNRFETKAFAVVIYGVGAAAGSTYAIVVAPSKFKVSWPVADP